MNGIRVGQWSIDAKGGHEFRYAGSWLDNPDARPISLSLPLALEDYTYRSDVVSAYFDNLLPDSSEIRQRIRSRYAAASLSAFDLLAEVGRDCVGAIQLLREDEEPRKTGSIIGNGRRLPHLPVVADLFIALHVAQPAQSKTNPLSSFEQRV
jgi:serine/threonine-protein kinase HipA